MKCDCCNYETKDLKFYNDVWLCEPCSGTLTSYFNREERERFETISILKAICYCTNLILDKIDSKKELTKDDIKQAMDEALGNNWFK